MSHERSKSMLILAVFTISDMLARASDVSRDLFACHIDGALSMLTAASQTYVHARLSGTVRALRLWYKGFIYWHHTVAKGTYWIEPWPSLFVMVAAVL